MPQLEVDFWTEDREDVVTYSVDGELKRPGEAVRDARSVASEDGHDDLNLKQVRLAETA